MRHPQYQLYKLKVCDQDGKVRILTKVADSLNFLKSYLLIEFGLTILDASTVNTVDSPALFN